MTETREFFVTAPKGMVELLSAELAGLGIADVQQNKGGVRFTSSIEMAYAVCLWSRLANRVLLCLDQFPCVDADTMYDGIRAIDWGEHIGEQATIAVSFVGSNAQIRHSHFGALRVKDAIADHLREASGQRPSVALDQPDIRINVYLNRDIASVYLDLSGDSLHRRNYRAIGAKAPLKENLAAAILTKAGWPSLSAKGFDLVDPMCGSGTLLIEAAMMAADIAPGIKRTYFGFLGWNKHKPEIWDRLLADAEQRRRDGLTRLPSIIGYDIDHRVIKAAATNINKAGLDEFIRVERRPVADARPNASHDGKGLVVTNPPYGERMGQATKVYGLYEELGKILRENFQGWTAAVLTGNPELGFRLGIRSRRPTTFFNGAIECKLLTMDVCSERFFVPKALPQNSADPETETDQRDLLEAARVYREQGQIGAEMFVNRLKKNLRTIGRWAVRNGVDCYRLYDADIPEHALAIDIYQGESRWVHVQEYQAPASIDSEKSRARLIQSLSVLPEVLDVDWDQVFLKVRRRQKGKNQYRKQGVPAHFVEVQESGYRFAVNFQTYLDTGLFLDHRITRQMIADMSAGKHFLNLFAYSGTASVFASKGGALSTTSVDLSQTYLDWARKNFALNGLNLYTNKLIQADCVDWIDSEVKSSASKRQYGLIFLDPPTFSNSKSMAATFDVQRDHVELIDNTAKLLDRDGILIFSTNFRKFKLLQDQLTGLKVDNIGAQTIPRDFARNPKIHYCWRIQRK